MEQRDIANLFDLTGQVVLITGGSRGLGLQIAQGLGAYGAQVVIVARKPQELESAVQDLRARGVHARAIAADLSLDGEAAKIVEDVLSEEGKLDALVNNAGANWSAPAHDYPIEGWRKVMRLSLDSVFELTQAAARQSFLPRRDGAILNVASIEGLLGHHASREGTVAYNAAKGGVIAMTRALAAEWGPYNIRVNALAPGFFPSKMTAQAIDEHGAAMLARTPLERFGGPTDLIGPAVMLLSNAGAFVTGQTLAVDGGWTAI